MTNFVLQPWHLLLSILIGMAHEEQQRIIEYLRTENQILKEKIRKNRILLNDDQRRRLAVMVCRLIDVGVVASSKIGESTWIQS